METTKQKLEMALKDAMRSNNQVAKNTARLVLSSMRLAEVEKGGQLDEPTQLALLQKEIKIRQESLEDARANNRNDLMEKAASEIAFLEAFLPKQLTADELNSMVKAAIEEVGAKTPADMGKVMKVLIPAIQGRAAGDQVSRAVREQLQNPA